MKARALIFSLGRRGAAPNQTFELARAMMARDELILSLCIAHQSDLRERISGLGLPTLIVSTYADMRGWEILSTLWRLPLALVAFAIFLRKQNPDIVLCPMGHLWNPFFIPLIRLCGARYALMVHDGQVKAGDHGSAPQKWNEIEVRWADTLIAMTEFVKAQLVDGLRRDAKSILVMPLGPFETAAGHQQSVQARAEKMRDLGSRRLLFFGRILDYKGLDILLDAFAILSPTYPHLSLTIAGSGDIAPYQSRLDRLVNVELDLRYIPEDEIPAIFAENDIVVLPYREATQSGVIAVAQTAGMPVVATPVGGLVEQIRDGETGILSADVTPEGLAAAIRRLLDDRSLYESISIKGQEHSRELWDIAARDIARLAAEVQTKKNAKPERSIWLSGPKRVMDVCLSALALLLFSIPLLGVALLVRLRLGAPILFRQMRPGLGGKPFELLKFRTMLDAQDSQGRDLPEEKRLTSFSRRLRASSLDELPELWNVFRGDMSLVGPRPLLMDYLPYYTDIQNRRHDVRPGLTGWAQVNGRNAQSWDERLTHDLYYVEHASFWLDLRIILLTILRVATRHGINAAEGTSMLRFDDEVRAGRATGRLPEGIKE